MSAAPRSHPTSPTARLLGRVVAVTLGLGLLGTVVAVALHATAPPGGAPRSPGEAVVVRVVDGDTVVVSVGGAEHDVAAR